MVQTIWTNLFFCDRSGCLSVSLDLSHLLSDVAMSPELVSYLGCTVLLLMIKNGDLRCKITNVIQRLRVYKCNSRVKSFVLFAK